MEGVDGQQASDARLKSRGAALHLQQIGAST
jgi:hypothetical protein